MERCLVSYLCVTTLCKYDRRYSDVLTEGVVVYISLLTFFVLSNVVTEVVCFHLIVCVCECRVFVFFLLSGYCVICKKIKLMVGMLWLLSNLWYMMFQVSVYVYIVKQILNVSVKCFYLRVLHMSINSFTWILPSGYALSTRVWTRLSPNLQAQNLFVTINLLSLLRNKLLNLISFRLQNHGDGIFHLKPVAMVLMVWWYVEYYFLLHVSMVFSSFWLM